MGKRPRGGSKPSRGAGAESRREVSRILEKVALLLKDSTNGLFCWCREGEGLFEWHGVRVELAEFQGHVFVLDEGGNRKVVLDEARCSSCGVRVSQATRRHPIHEKRHPDSMR